MFVVETVDDLWNHIAYVLGYAPDRFPHEDFLSPSDQMTLDKAFEQLHAGVLVAYPGDEAERRDELHKLLDRSYIAYRNGDEMLGGTLLNEFEDGIFKRPA
jgi:hypothetical protein